MAFSYLKYKCLTIAFNNKNYLPLKITYPKAIIVRKLKGHLRYKTIFCYKVAFDL